MGIAYERGVVLYARCRYREAAEQFRADLAVNVGSGRGQYMLGLSLLFAGDWAGADAAVRESIRVAPDMACGHYGMACVTVRVPGAPGVNGTALQRFIARWPDAVRRRLRIARGQVSTALQLDPNNADYFSLLAGINFDLKDYPAAISAARRGLAVQPDHLRCGTLLSRALAVTGNRSEADLVLGRVLARDPDFAPAHLASGWISLDRGDTRWAEAQMRESLRLDPTQLTAKVALRQALLARWPVLGILVRAGRRSRRGPSARYGFTAAGVFASVCAVAMSDSVKFNPMIIGVFTVVGIVAAVTVAAFVVWGAKDRNRGLRDRQDTRSSH